MTRTLPATQETLRDSPGDRGGDPLLRVLWRRQAWVYSCLAITLVLGGLYYTWAPRRYESTAQVLVVKKRPDAVTGVDTRQLAPEDYVSTHQVLIRSPLIIERAIKKGALGTLETFADEDGDLTEVISKALTVARNRGP